MFDEIFGIIEGAFGLEAFLLLFADASIGRQYLLCQIGLDVCLVIQVPF